MDDDQDVQTAESPDTEESTSSDTGGSLASLAEPSPAPSSNLAQALGSDTGTGQTSAPTQSPQPAQQSQPAQAPLQGLGGRLRGVLYGLATGGLRSAITGAVDPNMERQRYQDQNAIRHSQAQVAQAGAQAAQQNVQFESVKAADTHIRAMKEAQRIDQMNEAGRIEIQQKNAEYQDYLLNKFGIAPDLNISGVGDDVHSQASGGLNTLAAENNGQIPPVHAIVQPHTPDDKNFKIGVYSPNQQDIQKNQAGFRQLVDTERAVKGLGPIDDFTWNSGAGKGYQGQREMALEAQQFLSPVQPFSKDNLSAVLAQRQQQLDSYKSHTDINGKSDADPATVAALSKSVDFLQKAKDDLNKENIQTDIDKQNALANTPQGRLNTAEKVASIKEKEANIREKEDQDVVAFDPTYQNADGTKGSNVVMARGDAEQKNLPHYKIDASLVNANVAGMNDVQTKLNGLADVVNDTKRMSRVDPKLAAAMLNPTTGINLSFGGHGGEGGFGASGGIGVATDRINAWLNQANVHDANQATRDYVAAFLGAHEAITQLPRLQTFGKSSKMTQVQMEAALNLLPQPGDGASFSQQKMQNLQTMVDPLRKQMPHMPGSELIPSWLEKRSAGNVTIPGLGTLTP